MSPASSPQRAAVYARFSTDLQKDRSIEDQVAVCRSFAAREGMAVVAVYEDRARTSSSMFGRDGLTAMMDAARVQAFDVVVVEALDRISRDQEDLAGIYKRLTFQGIRIQAIHDGVADAVQIGVRGLLGGLFLADLAHKVRRGMTGVVRDGRHAGGKSYGYRPTPGNPGNMQIYEPEAEVVRRIFAEYDAGRSPRAIAHDLNRDKIPAPRGATWNASTINGSKQRGTGFLLNELYAGTIIWNRTRFVRDPDTGKRISRPNPESEWQRADAPHLRVVQQEMFDRVVARKQGRSHLSFGRQQPAKHLLTGLLKCGVCGGGMSSIGERKGRPRVMCSTAKESGSCQHVRRYNREDIEHAVVDGLTAQLTSPDALAAYVRAYHDEMQQLSATARRDRSRAETRLGEVTRELRRLVDALAKGILAVETISARLGELEAEKKELTAVKSQADEEAPRIALHPQAVERYRQDITALAKALPNAIDAGAGEAFRSLVQSVIVRPAPVGAQPVFEVVGILSRLIGHDVFPSTRLVGGPSGSGGGI